MQDAPAIYVQCWEPSCVLLFCKHSHIHIAIIALKMVARHQFSPSRAKERLQRLHLGAAIEVRGYLQSSDWPGHPAPLCRRLREHCTTQPDGLIPQGVGKQVTLNSRKILRAQLSALAQQICLTRESCGRVKVLEPSMFLEPSNCIVLISALFSLVQEGSVARLMMTMRFQTSRNPSRRGDLPRVCGTPCQSDYFWTHGSLEDRNAVAACGSPVPQRYPNPTEPHIQKDPSSPIP
jgi:hypothetical protein